MKSGLTLLLGPEGVVPVPKRFCKHRAFPKCFAWTPYCTSISVHLQRYIPSMVDSTELATDRTY